MNRLSNYFAAQKLAKQYLIIAIGRTEAIKDAEIKSAIRNLEMALREIITAMNNVASIGFNSKPRRKS